MANTTIIEYVVAFTTEGCYAGLFPGGDLARVGDPTVFGPEVESATMIDPTDAVNKIYAVDGRNSFVIDVVNNTIKSWSTEVKRLNLGTLPISCALATRYSGSMLLARQKDNSSIWYLSRKFNPMDFRFGQAPLATTAVAGTDPRIGQPADAIVALITSGDDYVIFGCRKSLYYMVGDPRANGQVLVNKNKVGILGPRAWCYDENGALLFLSPSGLMMLADPTGAPQNITGNRLVGLLDRVDVSTTQIQLAYDAFRKEAHVFLTPTDESAGTHVVVDREGGLWLDEYFAEFGPWSVVETNGEEDQDRRFLVGGNDGRIRQHDDSRTGDQELTANDTAFRAFADIGPLEVPLGDREVTLSEIAPFGFAGSGAATLEVFGSDSPDEVRVKSTNPELTATIFGDAGFNQPIGTRVTAGALKIRISQESKTDTLAIERLVAKFSGAGRRR